MKLSRRHAISAVLGVGLLSLTGCEHTNVYGVTCSTSPPVPHQDVGVLSMTANVPLEVEAGSTFTVTVKEIGVEAGPSEDPPPARYASLLSIGTDPSTIDLGSLQSPAVWPQEIELTVTGQPGEHVLLGVTSAGQLYGTPPGGYALNCAGPSQQGLFATIPIVGPDA